MINLITNRAELLAAVIDYRNTPTSKAGKLKAIAAIRYLKGAVPLDQIVPLLPLTIRRRLANYNHNSEC